MSVMPILNCVNLHAAAMPKCHIIVQVTICVNSESDVYKFLFLHLYQVGRRDWQIGNSTSTQITSPNAWAKGVKF